MLVMAQTERRIALRVLRSRMPLNTLNTLNTLTSSNVDLLLLLLQ